MSTMRKLAAAVLCAGAVLVTPGLAGAQTTTSTPTPATAANRTGARFDLAKAHAEAAIDRRLLWLNDLVGKVNGATHLTADHKSALLGQLTDEHSGLAALRTKIEGDTDWATLQPDATAIVHDYRVYLLMTPKTRLVVVGDDAEFAITRLEGVADKLAAEGKDVTDMRAKLADAKTQTDPVAGNVLPLKPQDYPGNQPTLTSARDALKTARTDIKAAIADAKALAK